MVLLSSIPIITPLVDANTQIQAKVSSDAGGSETVDLFVGYHTY